MFDEKIVFFNHVASKIVSNCGSAYCVMKYETFKQDEEGKYAECWRDIYFDGTILFHILYFTTFTNCACCVCYCMS